MVKHVLKKGCRAYVDTLEALVPCEVTRVSKNDLDLPIAEFKVTEARFGWPEGYVGETLATHVVPSKALYTRDSQYRVGPYEIEITL